MVGALGSSGSAGAATGSNTGSAGAGIGGPLDIGFAPVGRLNRTQYNNTVHDLLGTALNPADNFPVDETTLGFDTISGVLQVQPEHLEKYLSASKDLIDELFARPATDPWRTRILTCDAATGGATCQQQVVKAFATRAWRRPALDAELSPYLTLAAAQATPQEGLAIAMRAVLVSTRFLYRREADPSVDDTRPHRVTSYELASRLSYFLWGTMPDDGLFALADSGALLSDATLHAQIARMVSDPVRGPALVETFGAQWLNVNRMQAVTPDPMLFPLFNDSIRAAMMQETKYLLWDFVSNARPASQLLNADFTYVNGALASFYGIAGVTATAMQKVPVAGTHRSGGLLTQGSTLVGTSNPSRTSPVKRGLFVLDRLLCAAPPPPPATVNTNIDQGSGLENLSVRQRLAQHQQKGAACAGCHSVMDAIGLGEEHFDAVGRYRDNDGFGPVDATGVLPAAGGTGTTKFDGVDQLAQLLAADTRLVPCMVQKLLTFGLGRSFDNLDLRDQIAAGAMAKGGTLPAAIEAVVTSDAFRSRRAAAVAEVMP